MHIYYGTNGTSVITPFALESTFCTIGSNLFIALQSTQSLLLGGSPGCSAFLGTTTMGLAQGETLLVITPASSKLLISLWTHSACF